MFTIKCKKRGDNRVSLKSLLKKIILRVSDILLPVSIGFVAVAVTLLMLGDLRLPKFILPLISFLSAGVLLSAGILLRTHSRFSFAATFLLLTGGLMLFVDLGVVALSLRVLWPVMTLFVGVSFLSSGFMRFRRPRAVFVTPAVVFLFLGIVFLLFSTRQLRFSILSEYVWWYPVVFLPVIAFVVWYIRRNAYGKGHD